MFVKFVKNENQADNMPSKKFFLVECMSANIREVDCGLEKPTEHNPYPHLTVDVWIQPGVCDNYPVTGNVYFLNNEGKTIESYWPSN